MSFAVPSLRLALVLAVLFTQGLSAAADEPRAHAASGSARLKYLPNDYWFVGELDCRTIMNVVAVAGAAQQNPQYAQLKQGLKMVEQFTGIDVESDVHWLTVFAAGPIGDMPEGMAVVQGKFDNATVAERITKAPNLQVTEEAHKGTRIYRFAEQALCFPEDSTLLVGDPKLIQLAIDRLGKPHALPVPLQKVLQQTPGDHVVWAALQPKTVLQQKPLTAWKSANGDLAGMLEKLECVSLFFDVGQEGFLIHSLGYAGMPGTAKSVYQYLSTRKKDLLHQEGTNVAFASLLMLSEIKMDGQLLDGSFRLTAKGLQELWDTKFIVRPAQKP
jgi:hypothetical protein